MHDNLPTGLSEAERRAIEADCARLIHKYVNLADAGRWTAVADLYTADARFARPSKPGEWVEGRDAILASFTARPARAQRHVVANVVVDAESADCARAFSVILLFTGAGLAPLIGSYTDRLVREADGWRFAERVGALDFQP
ncbi:nuclear transport factor 2 family protein [Croceibacterium sp. TMG7-5b_MA50]|uniref:nuclear transport factor 2 family protein n=1 Tax=Croceibacterium sp. TMG7-5b_MA50 TaxID=3121290 RepID=UPI003221F165